MVNDLRSELKAHRPVTSLLKNIHDAARGLRTEIDLSGDSPWSRQLTAIRTEVSNVLRGEIESTPGRVRCLLRPRPTKEIVPGSQLDETDVAEAELMVEFVGACRTYAHELAVNEMTMRSYTELQNYLESGTKVLLDGLRASGRCRPGVPAVSDGCGDSLLPLRIWCRLCGSVGESGRNSRSDHRF